MIEGRGDKERRDMARGKLVSLVELRLILLK